MASDHFRSSARFPVNLTATLGTGRVEPQEASVVDLGLGGACLEVGEPPPTGSELVVVVSAPMLWEPLELRGEVAWRGPGASRGTSRIGVRFEHESPVVVGRLFDLLEVCLSSAQKI